jgi:uncharacterized membrane protein
VKSTSTFALLMLMLMLAAVPAAAANPVMVYSRLHMPMLHFPVALLVVALLVELVLGRRSQAHRPTVSFILVVATIASFIAASSGIALENAEATSGEMVERHEIVGIATAIVALLATLAYRQKDGVLRKLSTPILAVAAALVMVTGHLGGKLVHGADYYAEAFAPPGEHKPVDDTATTKGPADDEYGAETAEARARHPEGAIPEKPDYATHIAPLFKRSCVKCHGAEKRKAGLRLDAKRFAMKGGESGAAIVPADPAKSLVYTMSALNPDDEDVMPTKGNLLALSEIETIKRWIEQGAVWPDDVAAP